MNRIYTVTYTDNLTKQTYTRKANEWEINCLLSDFDIVVHEYKRFYPEKVEKK